MEKFELLNPETINLEKLEPEAENTELTTLFDATGIVDIKLEEPEENSEGKKAPEEKKPEESNTPTPVGDAELLVIDIVDYFDEEEELPALKEEMAKLTSPEEKIAFLKDKLDEKIATFAESKVKETEEKVLTPLQQKFKSLVEIGVSAEESANIVIGYDNLTKITKEQLEEDVDLAKKVYTNYLKLTTSFTEDTIKRTVERAEKLGTLNEVSVESFEELKTVLKNKETEKVEAAKKLAEDKAKAEAKEIEDHNAYLEQLSTIGGINLTTKMKNNLVKSFTSQNGVDPIQELASYNKREFNTLIRFITANMIKKDEKTKSYVLDFSPVQATIEKKAVDTVTKNAAAERAKALMNSTLNKNENIDSPEDLFAALGNLEQKLKSSKN